MHLHISLISILVQRSRSWKCLRGSVADQVHTHAQGLAGSWKGVSLSFFHFFSKFLSNLNRTNANVPVFTARQTKAALELGDVVTPPHATSAGVCAGAATINSLLVAHLSPHGVTRGLSPLNRLPLCHCLLISVYSLEDIDCITISHHVQQSLELISHTEFIGLCGGDKGRLVGSWTQKANTMYGFLNNTKAGE